MLCKSAQQCIKASVGQLNYSQKVASVTCQNLQLSEDRSQSACSWKELVVGCCDCIPRMLAHLPLHSLSRVSLDAFKPFEIPSDLPCLKYYSSSSSLHGWSGQHATVLHLTARKEKSKDLAGKNPGSPVGALHQLTQQRRGRTRGCEPAGRENRGGIHQQGVRGQESKGGRGSRERRG
jgi:hypothetical protein